MLTISPSFRVGSFESREKRESYFGMKYSASSLPALNVSLNDFVVMFS